MGHFFDVFWGLFLCVLVVTCYFCEGIAAADTKSRDDFRFTEQNFDKRGVPVNVNTKDGIGSTLPTDAGGQGGVSPSAVASYRCGENHDRRSLVVVSSMNGAVTALDLSENGQKLWDLDAGTGPLLSSSLSSENFVDGEKKILPALDGDLYTWDGTHLEACPFTTDSLISSSFKLSDNVMVVGSKSTRTYGINANTGKLVYSCSPEECTNIGPQPASSDDVIVTKFQQQVVRALDQRTGDEKWNYSVGQHDVKYIVGYRSDEDDSVCRSDGEEVLSKDKVQLRISMEYNMVFGVKEKNHREIIWSHEFSSDIANVWTIVDGEVKELDILSLDIDPSLSQEQNLIPYADPIMPSFIGRFKDQLYVRPSSTQKQHSDDSTTASPFELIADETGYGLVPRIRWRPYLSSADSRTPILAHSGKQQSDDLGFIGPVEKPGDAAHWSQYPFDAGYPLPWLPNKCPKTNLLGGHTSKPKPALSDNESVQSSEKGIDVLLGLSVWNWWREMLISSIAMAIGWQLLYQFVLKAACDVPVANAQSEVVFAEEAVRVDVASGASKGFKSRYLSDFSHQECLGKGGFGIVFQAQNRVDESSYAIKRICLPHREAAREKVLREARALARLEHIGIVRYFQSWIEEPPPGWQEENDQLLMGVDTSANEAVGSFTTSATFTKDSQLLRDKRRFLRQTSLDNSSNFFGGGGDDSPVPSHHFEDEESGSFSIEFKSGVSAPKKTVATLEAVSKSSLSQSDNENSSSIPFQRYSKVDENSDSLDIVFEDSGCSAKSETNSSRKDTDAPVSSEAFLVTDMAHHSVTEENKERTKNDSSAISELPLEAEPPKSRIYLYIQMQLCQKETLKDWLGQNTTESRDRNKILHIFQQILGAVNYVHLCGMIHRDLKPSNIFFSMDGTVKVGDFGLVTAMDTELKAELQIEESESTHHTSQVGTQLYMSPEQVKGHSYDHKVDIFSLGLILFELLYPFSTQMERVSVLFQVKSSQKFPSKFLEEMPTEKELVQWLLSPDPKKRPTTDEIMDSEFFKDLYQNFSPPLERMRSRYSSSLS